MPRNYGEPVVFLRPKRIILLIRIQNNPNNSLQELRQGIYTHSAISNTINEFKKAELVTTKRVQLEHGTSTQPKLTEKGEKILDYLKIITPYLK